jgi:hypothetical protein
MVNMLLILKGLKEQDRFLNQKKEVKNYMILYG